MKALKNFIVYILFAVTIIGIKPGMTEAKEKNVIKHYNLDDTGIALQGYSPVSYFEKGKAEKGKKEFKVTDKGVHYYFTSAEQKKTFLENRTKYEPAFGGWCALGMAVEGRFRIDPESFKIVNGRLFLFLNNVEVDAKVAWNQKSNEGELTRKADKFWKKVSGEDPVL